jgi:3-deoxy-D-manno-octulosonate 8-phosphate phosphatase KdsC-like HAD superfamily phosphatase
MGSWLVERRLTKVGSRLKALRAELAVIDEQLLYLGDDADDQAIRAMVAETASSSFEARSAQGNFENMTKHRNKVVAEIVDLEHRQDELLDQMIG